MTLTHTRPPTEPEASAARTRAGRTRWPAMWIAAFAGAVAVGGGAVGGHTRLSSHAAALVQPAPQGLAADVQGRLATLLPPRLDGVFRRLETGFDSSKALALVTALDGTWRLAGNDAFEMAQDRVLERLLAAGFRQVPQRPSPLTQPSVWFESFRNAGHGWSHAEGRLSVIEPDGQRLVLLSRAEHRLTVCINSFSTAPGGVTAEVVDVGSASAPEALAAFDLAGRIVLGDADVAQLYRVATAGGAIGVISTTLAPYINPTPASSTGAGPARASWDILQWGTIPYDERVRGFGFKATPRAAQELRSRLRSGGVRVHVEIAASFSERPNRTLVAEIPGEIRPDEHVVLVAHVQEPGANDNASGVATLQETAVSLLPVTSERGFGRPARSLTFLWGDELAASREWLRRARDKRRTARYMVALDMTGHDVAVTGGSFLIEKVPDPSAVAPSPLDPHTPWGAGQVDDSWVRGTLLNDLVLAICARYGARERWGIRTNPYEGGSDHTVFLGAGVPALLMWHFPDRYYHTNFDRADKTSADEMRRVGISVGAAALMLTTATQDDALALVGVVRAAALDRIAREASRGADPAAWRRWYHEALDDVAQLAVSPSSAALSQAIARAQSEVSGRAGPLSRPAAR